MTNQHHDFTRLTDATSRELFKRLEGSRTPEQLADELETLARADILAPVATNVSRAELRTAIDERLQAWARHALLTSPSPS